MTEGTGLPLEGVKVIDFSTYVAAPAAAMLFGYLGADIIRVEPLKGDPLRGVGPQICMPGEEDRNPLFDSINAYKRCISLDLRSDEGKKIMRRLLETADAFVTNYRTKALEGIGIAYEQVKDLNPKLVYAHMEGFGSKGPDADDRAFDSIAYFARSGISESQRYRECPPMVTQYGSGDIPAGTSFATGILSMLYKAARTGKGGKVTSSLFSAGLWTMSCAMARNKYNDNMFASLESTRTHMGHHNFLTAEGKYVRLIIWEIVRYWEPLCRAFKLDWTKDDPRFCSIMAVYQHEKDYIDLIDGIISKMTVEELAPLLKANGIPFAVVQSPLEAGHDPQAEANGYVCDLEYPAYNETVRFPMPPVQIEGTEPPERHRGPLLGEQTASILAEAGYTPEEIDAFLASGSVFQHA